MKGNTRRRPTNPGLAESLKKIISRALVENNTVMVLIELIATVE